MNRKLYFLFALMILLFLSAFAAAAEKADVCVKFKKDYGWSKGYAVQGTVISGSELNAAVGSFTRFKSISTYVVVFWDQDQASIFELPAMTLGSVPMFETEVKDQLGRTWKIKAGHFMCN